MRLSIIIPIYNVAKWLPRCLSSVVEQGLDASDFEIILVNDGTTDNSMEVFAAFKAAQEQSGKYWNWKVLQQENQGLSVARNEGLGVAQGTYVWWVDSDDYLQPKCAVKLLQRAEQAQLDVLCFGLQVVEEQGTIIEYPIKDRTKGAVTEGPEFLQSVSMPPSAWSAFYRREFLHEHQLEFLPGAMHEDQDFTPRAYFFAKRIAFENMVVYNYFQRTGSIMKSENPKKTNDLLQICDRLWNFALQHTEEDTPIRYVFINRVSFLFSQALSNLCRCKIHEFPGDWKKLPYYPLSINKYLSKKERYKYRLINVNVPLYMKLYHKFVNTEKPKTGVKKLRTR